MPGGDCREMSDNFIPVILWKQAWQEWTIGIIIERQLKPFWDSQPAIFLVHFFIAEKNERTIKKRIINEFS